MILQDRLNQLNRFHCLIKRRGTGSPRTLSRRLGISQRSVLNYLDVLKSYGADIGYCRQRETYYYRQPIEFDFNPIAEVVK